MIWWREMRREIAGAVLFLVACFCGAGEAGAQDIEPRRWTQLPTGTSVVGLGYVYTDGQLSLDPVLRIDEADLVMQTYLGSFNYYFALGGMTARIDVKIPVQDGLWEGVRAGVPVSATRHGMADPRIRLSIDFIGAPAVDAAEFMEYRKEHSTNTVVGAAIAVQLPLGEYMEDKLINLGENRYVITSQLGAVHTHGPWSFELTGSVYFYTDNDEFFGNNTLEQDPLYGGQAHVVRTLSKGWWVSAGVGYSAAGMSWVNGVSNDDEKSNLLYGASFGFPLGRAAGFRVGYIGGRTLTDIGTDSESYFASLSLRF